MPFPTKLLNPGETIVIDRHPHWSYFRKPVVAFVLCLVAGTATLVTGLPSLVGLVVLVPLVLCALWLVKYWLSWSTTNFVVTTDRLIYRHGVLAKSGIEIPVERVMNVNFSQSVIERLMGAGDLLIESGGEDGQQRFTDIRNPSEVQNKILAQTASNRQVVVPAAAVDIVSQLERLEALRDRGSISDDEFVVQKARLLGS